MPTLPKVRIAVRGLLVKPRHSRTQTCISVSAQQPWGLETKQREVDTAGRVTTEAYPTKVKASNTLPSDEGRSGLDRPPPSQVHTLQRCRTICASDAVAPAHQDGWLL